jgi:hypothetical protein
LLVGTSFIDGNAVDSWAVLGHPCCRQQAFTNWTRPRDREAAGPHRIAIIVQEKAAALSMTERKSM